MYPSFSLKTLYFERLKPYSCLRYPEESIYDQNCGETYRIKISLDAEGLSLDIAGQIVIEKHDGAIGLNSISRQGTKCSINFISKSSSPWLDLCLIKLVQLSRRFLLLEYISGVKFIDSKIFLLCVFPSFTCG